MDSLYMSRIFFSKSIRAVFTSWLSTEFPIAFWSLECHFCGSTKMNDAKSTGSPLIFPNSFWLNFPVVFFLLFSSFFEEKINRECVFCCVFHSVFLMFEINIKLCFIGNYIKDNVRQKRDNHGHFCQQKKCPWFSHESMTEPVIFLSIKVTGI